MVIYLICYSAVGAVLCRTLNSVNVSAGRRYARQQRNIYVSSLWRLRLSHRKLHEGCSMIALCRRMTVLQPAHVVIFGTWQHSSQDKAQLSYFEKLVELQTMLRISGSRPICWYMMRRISCVTKGSKGRLMRWKRYSCYLSCHFLLSMVQIVLQRVSQKLLELHHTPLRKCCQNSPPASWGTQQWKFHQPWWQAFRLSFGTENTRRPSLTLLKALVNE